MKISDKNYTRGDLLQRVGNIHQLGGTRHYVLNDGRAKGIASVDFDCGTGFRFTVLPDRGMDISLASFKGLNLVHQTANGEVHPAYFDPYGLGWLRTFFAGLLTTCGLTYLGGPVKDGDEELGAHGRQSTNPASQVCDLSRWEDDEYVLELSGVMDETVLFGDKIRLTRTITSRIGARSIAIRDVAENFGYKTSPFTILYHINPGFPLLDACSRLMLTAKQTRGCDDHSSTNISKMLQFSDPVPGFHEENFHHIMAADPNGDAWAGTINPDLGLALYIRWDARVLPFMNEWKMMGQGDYVVGMEPCNVPCEDRVSLRKSGMLQHIEPGEKKELNVEIGVLEGEPEIEAFLKCVDWVLGGSK